MPRALLLDREDVALRLAPEVLYPEHKVAAPPLADRRRTPGSRRRNTTIEHVKYGALSLAYWY